MMALLWEVLWNVLPNSFFQQKTKGTKKEKKVSHFVKRKNKVVTCALWQHDLDKV
jgi:hypothetical protein